MFDLTPKLEKKVFYVFLLVGYIVYSTISTLLTNFWTNDLSVPYQTLVVNN